MRKLRLRRSGSSGGHNGLKSIFETLGTQDIPRLRVGLGPVPEGQDPAEFVLQNFRKDEEATVAMVIKQAEQAVRAVISDGLESAMNRFNAASEADV